MRPTAVPRGPRRWWLVAALALAGCTGAAGGAADQGQGPDLPGSAAGDARGERAAADDLNLAEAGGADGATAPADGPAAIADAPGKLDGGCQPGCGAAECGANGCGGSCGSCTSYESCSGGWCEAPATASGAPPVRVLTYNACGNKCSYVGVSSSSWAAALFSAISYWSADAVLFTELCYGQLAALRSKQGSGWGYVWLASHPAPAGCARWGSDLRFGMAILAKHSSDVLPSRLTATLSKTATCGDTNPRQLLCAQPLVDGKATLTCVTHLTTGTVACRTA